jgi:hypothetical protein
MAKKINLTDLENKNLELLPIRRGCGAGMCACLGTCLQVIGYIPRKDYEEFIKTIPSTDEFLSKYVKTDSGA